MDPPWQLASSNPTRGVTIGYSHLTDDDIFQIGLKHLQKNDGFLFIWVINAKLKETISQMKRLGYKLIDQIVWVKRTVNRRVAKGHVI
jgi:mRNA (2'-O-methyladenosine-N6-)-methyltransferase